jgi:predicted TIM-barrel fold metal-dependent hydrolase
MGGAMTVAERLISADSHVALRHEQVKEYLATRFHDAYDAAAAQHEAKVGAAKQHSNLGDYWFRPGHWDAAAHLDDMDLDGLAVEVVYCEVSAFRYLYLMREGGTDATRAFNDALHAYASVDPSRLIVSYQIPIHDMDFAVSEVQRVASFGGKSLQLPVFPVELGQPDYCNARYEPLWAAVQETGLPICCHTGMNAQFDNLATRDPTPQRALCVPLIALSSAEAMGMWILGGVFERFPGLKVVFVEPGLGWVAWWLDAIDDMAQRQHYDYPAITDLPSAYFRRNMFLTFMEEPRSVQLLRDRLGVTNIMWASDYPHPPTTWPNSRAAIDKQFSGVPNAERRQIVCDNAARVWRL